MDSPSQPDTQPGINASVPSTSTQRISALPRPTVTSKLPLPKSSIPSLRPQPSLTSLSRPTNASAARTKAAAASLAQQKARTPLTTTQPNNRGPAHLRTASTASNASQDGAFKKPTTRPLSRANLQARQRQVSASSSKASTIHEDDLGSLHSFRSDATYSTATTSPSTPMTPTLRKSSRPSLSERTIESLASIPPSPASIRRKSSFFSPDSPMQQLSRPASALSRPESQDGGRSFGTPFTPRGLAAKPSMPNLSASVRSKFPNGASAKTIRARSPTKASLSRAVEKDGPTPIAAKTTPRVPLRGSKTVAGRVQQPRGSVADLFGGDLPKSSSTPKTTPISTAKSTPKPMIKKAAKPAVPPNEAADPSPKAAQAAKSSASLREQIRAAKAARLSSSKPEQQAQSTPDFDPAAFADPFNTGPKDERSLIRRRVDTARSDGRLNISAMGLKELPEEVLKMYDYDANAESSIQWNEVVDLVRFVAAENEIETIGDAFFPDLDPRALEDDGEGALVPKFGGIEVLDLHGNVLFDVPLGLRRLECLTSLNLSRNRLMSDSLETISQIPSLRELRLSDNLLTGELLFIDSLTNLELLDVSDNKLSVLPDEIRSLTRLRSLNVSNNSLTSLPMIELAALPLSELYASKNKLEGVLFTTAGVSMPRLQILDVSINALTSLYTGSCLGPDFPSLRSLNVSFNALSSLPAMSAWTSLSSLLAEDNKLTALPEGFTDSSSLKTVDLTGNDLNKLDERIALMEGLDVLRIGANPLRERKWLTMGTAEVKKELGARLEEAGFVL